MYFYFVDYWSYQLDLMFIIYFFKWSLKIQPHIVLCLNSILVLLFSFPIFLTENVTAKTMLSSKTNLTNVPLMSPSSVKSRGEHLCDCQGRIISYQCKKGPNKGTIFWRCPFWMGDDTCDLFIWDEDMVAKYGNKGESNMNEVVGNLKELYEDVKKKNKSLKH